MNTTRELFQSRDKVCETVLDLLSIMANKTRFRILCLLREGDYCVNDICEIVDLGTPSHISQQLKILTLFGALDKYRNKKAVIYRLKDDKIRNLIAYLEKTFMESEV